MKQTQTINSLTDLNSFATKIVQDLETTTSEHEGATIVALTGGLGAGKTTLSQMIGKTLGVTEPMSSPTFVISKYYDLKKQTWKRLIHIDAYRLDGQNLNPLDFPTLFADPNNIILIEWPEYVESVLPKTCINISITHNKDDSRTIDIV